MEEAGLTEKLGYKTMLLAMAGSKGQKEVLFLDTIKAGLAGLVSRRPLCATPIPSRLPPTDRSTGPSTCMCVESSRSRWWTPTPGRCAWWCSTARPCACPCPPSCWTACCSCTRRTTWLSSPRPHRPAPPQQHR